MSSKTFVEEKKGPESSETVKSSRVIGPYQIYDTLGKGGYSWVKKGRDSRNGMLVALKFLKKEKRKWAVEQNKLIRTEIKCLTSIEHVNVMKIWAYNLNTKYPLSDGGTMDTIMLVLEYCQGGELFDILYYANRLDETSARTYFHQLVFGLQAIHKAGIVHRDIKPQNLLLDSSFNLKICDFGLSKIFANKEDQLMKTSRVGTRGYQAPEIVERVRYSKACDIFSAGVVFFLLMTGYPPFEAAHATDKWYNPLIVGDAKKFWHYHRDAGLSEEAKTLLEGMFCYKAKNRWNLDEIIKCNWFNREVLKSDEIKSKIVGRYVQARAKKAKKNGDIPESPIKRKIKKDIRDSHAHSYDRDGQPTPSTEEEEISPKPIPVGLVSAGLTTFHSAFSPDKTISSINGIFQTDLLIETNYQDSQPHHIKCRANIGNCRYEFFVKAYRDEESVHTLLQIKSTLKPDPFQWARYYRKIIDIIMQKDILISNIPACIQPKDGWFKKSEGMNVDAVQSVEE